MPGLWRRHRGGTGQGISYSAAPGARVSSPCAGTVLFAGAFPSYGHVVIASCGGDTSVVLAGMSTLDVASGERLAHGQPVGAMLGYDPAAPTRQPVLYVELRQHGTPVDPFSWLAPQTFLATAAISCGTQVWINGCVYYQIYGDQAALPGNSRDLD